LLLARRVEGPDMTGENISTTQVGFHYVGMAWSAIRMLGHSDLTTTLAYLEGEDVQ
jgi:hypothetical protein